MNDEPRKIKFRRLQRQRDRAIEVLTVFDDDVLKTIEYRSQLSAEPDGFPGGGSSDRSAGEISDSTGNAALRLIEGHLDPDIQQHSMVVIASSFAAMWKSLEEAERSWDVILHVSESIRGRQTALGSCQACLRDDVPNVGNDRIRSGYCQPCYKAWCRTDQGHGRQDRLAFERSRRKLEVVRGDMERAQ